MIDYLVFNFAAKVSHIFQSFNTKCFMTEKNDIKEKIKTPEESYSGVNNIVCFFKRL